MHGVWVASPGCHNSLARRLAVLLAGLGVLVGSSGAFGGGPSTGLVPLTELGAGTYQGFPGGLYPGSVNEPPPGHAAAAAAAAAAIMPRDAAGAPDPNGFVGLIAIGMSNTFHEFSVFERQEDLNTGRNARVVILNTAHPGQTASTIANSAAMYWTIVSDRIAAAGLTAEQVQVAWMKEANGFPQNNFPVHAQQLRDNLRTIVQILHDRFPNLRICYLSSRIYGGYATGPLNPEPMAYESGFSVRWVIEQQIAGDPALNHDAARGPVRAPVLLWGPYLWADGVMPRSDGLTWLAGDFESDGTHPSASGEQKVGDLLSAYFGDAPSAGSWWPVQPGARLVPRTATADTFVSAGFPDSNDGASGQLRVQGGATPRNTYLKFSLAGVRRPALLAKLSLRCLADGGGNFHRVDETTWGESTITYNNAPPIGLLLGALPQAPSDGTIALDLTADVNADADGVVSYANVLPVASPLVYHSREAGQPPRLVLVVSTRLAGDLNCDGVVDHFDIDPFVLALVDPAGYQQQFPDCDRRNGDANGDGQVNNFDINAFIALLTQP